MSSIISRLGRAVGTDLNKGLAHIELRQIVAKIPIETGITVPPAVFRILRRLRQRHPPIGSNMLLSGHS
jgi:hypothetical protein